MENLKLNKTAIQYFAERLEIVSKIISINESNNETNVFKNIAEKDMQIAFLVYFLKTSKFILTKSKIIKTPKI
jgi:hypothetical protein